MRVSVVVVASVAALTAAGAGVALISSSGSDAGGPVAAQPPAVTRAAVPSGFEEVDLALMPRDQAGLAQLALVARTLPPAVREARRQAALPGTARAATVADAATGLGLTLISTTDTNVVVAGPPDRVRSLFGSTGDNPTPQTLPRLPPSLTGLVLVAAGNDQTRPVVKPRNNPDGSLSQADLRRVYGVPAASAPPTATSPTVATLQFSDWHPGDLTKYVQSQHIYGVADYDPIADGGFSAVGVGGGNAGDYSGAGEVSLDQETIATMAPGLRQRAYFVPNSDAMGQADAINQIAHDAAAQHILTLSTSFGSCEADAYTGPDDPLLTVDENAINNVLAAGVTFFAPSGDDGSTDCPDTHPGTRQVDSPASFPNVVAVGGTTVHTGGGRTTQTGWSGSGGGYSTLFPRPSYQDAAIAGDRRGVPDIAMVADDATGLEAYDSTPTSADGCDGSCAGSPVGGTSFAAPLAAAALASVLADRGDTTGIGDIHAVLYGASPGAVTDVTSGRNGAFSSGSGWDAVTGLGAPRWSTLLSTAS